MQSLIYRLFILTSYVLILSTNSLCTEETQLNVESKMQDDNLKIQLKQSLIEKGYEAYTSQEYEKAIDYYKQALAIAQDQNDKSYQGAILNELGNVNYALQQYREALNYYQQSLSIAQQIDDRDVESSASLNLGNIYYSLNQYDKAIEYYLETLSTSQEENLPNQGIALLNIGISQIHLSNYKEALEYLKKALSIARGINNRNMEFTALLQMGNAYNMISQYNKAMEYYSQSLSLARNNNKESAAEGYALLGLGNTYSFLGQYELSINNYQQALAIARAVNDRNGERDALASLGNSYNALSQYDKAIENYNQALAITRESNDRFSIGTIYLNVGNSYNALSKYDKAIENYNQALAVAREVKDRKGEGIALMNLGDVYNALSEYEKSIEFSQKALVIMQELHMIAYEGNAFFNLGNVYTNLSRYDKAILNFKQALNIAGEINDIRGEGRAFTGLAVAYYYLGKYEEAIYNSQQALAIAQESKDRFAEGSILLNLGNVYESLSQYDKAIEHFERTLAIAREIKDKRTEGRALTNIGLIYESLSQHDKAINYYEQAFVIALEIKDRKMEEIILLNVSSIYFSLSKYHKAIEPYEQTLAIAHEIKDRRTEGIVLGNLGVIYKSLGRDEESLRYYVQSLFIAQEIKNRNGEGIILGNLMLLWNDLDQSRLAIFYGKQAVNTYQEIRGNIKGLEKESQQSFLTSKEDTYRTLADLLISEGRLPEAQQVLGMLKEEEYFEFVRRDGETADSLSRSSTLTPKEAEWEKRYKEIGDKLAAIGTEYGELLKKAEKTTLSDAEEKKLAQLEQDLEVSRQAFDKFLEDLKNEFSSKEVAEDKVYDIQETQGLMSDLQELGEGTVAVYTLINKDKYTVMLLTPNVQIAGEYKIKEEDLNKKVAEFREALQNPNIDPRPIGKELYEIILGPISRQLADAKAETLMWSLDGVLRYIPMGALYDGKSYMVEKYRNVVFTPASNARLKDDPKTAWKGLGLGVSEAHEDFAALPGVAEELSGIIKEGSEGEGVLPGSIRLDGKFNKEEMKRELRKKYPVVHIASHFRFQPGNETDSFLLLGDGSHLTLAEIDKLPNVFGGVDLLTLSACDTATGGGDGKGKEVEGFGVLAQRQGAKAVMATLWPVADVSTVELMKRFYELRETKKLSKAEALRQAQLELLRGNGELVASKGNESRGVKVKDTDGKPTYQPGPKAPYSHPYYWAPFILIGNWK